MIKTDKQLHCIHGKSRDSCIMCEQVATLYARITLLEEENHNLRAFVKILQADADINNFTRGNVE